MLSWCYLRLERLLSIMPSRKHAKITKSTVEKLGVGDEIRDTELRGFIARNQNGVISYAVHKRVRGGPLVLVTIGPHGSPWTPTTAREQAQDLALQMSRGINPNAKRREEKQRANTLQDVAEKFRAAYGPKLKARTREEYERLLRNAILPELGVKPVAELTRADVEQFHGRRADRPHHANFALAVLSKLMTWAEQNGLRPEGANPCRGVKKYPANKKERFLSPAEFARLGEAIQEAQDTGDISVFSAAAIRLLVLTGARKSEILGLKWTYVDLERGLLNLPDSKTGAKTIRLSPPAIEVLTTLPRLAGNPYVICGQVEGQPIVNLQKPWNRVRRKAGLADCRIHDLRHSFASMAAASGASLPMIGKLLGHSNVATTQRYAHLADDPLHELNANVAGAIAAAMKPAKPEQRSD